MYNVYTTAMQMKIPNHGDIGIGCIYVTCPCHIYIGLVCVIHIFTNMTDNITCTVHDIAFTRGLH